MSVRAFLFTFLGTIAAALLVAGGVVLLFAPLGWKDGLLVAFLGSIKVGLVAVLVCYGALYWQERATWAFPEDELRESERVLMHSPGVSHFAGGSPLRTWEAIDGRLFLTNQRIVFLAFRMQLRRSQVYQELGDIRRANAGEGLTPSVLHLTTAQGQELFTFGAFQSLEAERWAAAILLARYRSDPERDWAQAAADDSNRVLDPQKGEIA